MTRILILCFLSFIVLPQFGHAQKAFSTYLGFGLGRHFEQRFPYIDQTSNGRIGILINQYARVSPRFSIGVSAMASGRLSALLGGAPAPSDYYDPVSKIQIINYNNQNAATYLIKGKYVWMKKKTFDVYSDIGLGVSRYRYVQATQSALSFAPEVGIRTSSFQFAPIFIWGGKTPSFTAPSFPNTTELTSIKSNRLYFVVSYRIFNF